MFWLVLGVNRQEIQTSLAVAELLGPKSGVGPKFKLQMAISAENVVCLGWPTSCRG